MKFVPISTGLIEHCPRMREAVWLFIFLVDKQTKGIRDGRGQVLGGSPIRDRDIAEALRVSTKTVSRWREVLLAEGYITARRTAYGYVYGINKPKKWREEIGQKCLISDQTEPAERSDKNGTRSDKVVRNKEEIQEIQEREAAATASVNTMEKKLSLVWRYFQDALGRDESISPSEKECGLAVAKAIQKRGGDPVETMAAVIDMAAHKAKTTKNPNKLSWFLMFARPETCQRWVTEYQRAPDGAVPEAAAELEEYQVTAD